MRCPVPGSASLSSPAATTSVISRSTSLRWEVLAERQVQRHPLDPTPPSLGDAAAGLAQAGAVKPWRRIEVSRSSTTRGRAVVRPCSASAARSSSRPTVWITRGSSGTAVEGAPRRQHQQGAVEALLDLGQLVVGADRDGVDPQPLGLAGQPAPGRSRSRCP